MTSLQAEPATTTQNGNASRARTRFLAGGLLLLFVLIALPFCLAFFLADRLLALYDPPGKVDVIVVLGGDGPSRAAWAAHLWGEGLAPRVLISGDGDCYSIRQAMTQRGVDESVITVECHSGSTFENALFSAPILKQMGARSGIVVTSWFASRRAMASFEAAAGNIAWKSMPVKRIEPLWRLALSADGLQLLKEYPKTLWYSARLLQSAGRAGSPYAAFSREAEQ